MLTYRELKAIQDGHRRNADVMVLLREIRRLRDLATASYGVLGAMTLGSQSEEIRAAVLELCDRLLLEPAVQAYQVARKKQEDLEYRRGLARSTSTSADPKLGTEGPPNQVAPRRQARLDLPR